MKKRRCFARILETNTEPSVRHFIGVPLELTGGKDARVQLPSAKLLIVEQKDEGYFFFRYANDRSFAGDTWHMRYENAIEQAVFEFKESLGEWITIPDDETDAVAYAYEQCMRTK